MAELINYNPDVLSCLANLSNDEVFTPPEIADKIIDLLPQNLFENKNTTFLDPGCKSGIFLREIAKRLMEGLEKKIPNRQERINHIFTKQLYALPITELTSLLSRRSVYCSKKANGNYSIAEGFDNEEGNILFKKTNHTWVNGRCTFCGASENVNSRDESLDSHAYQFIHTENPKEIFNMKFDVIIGNPPYQLSDGGGRESSAMPLYNKFVEQAKKLNPRFLAMIIPARWYSGGKGLDKFRISMLEDQKISQLHDYPETADCFPGINIRGGVCYFLWQKDYSGNCDVYNYKQGELISKMSRPLLEKNQETFVRFNSAIDILKKVSSFNERNYGDIVSSRKPFGIESNTKDFKNEISKSDNIMLYKIGSPGFISKEQIVNNYELVNKIKVLVSKASPGGDDYPHKVISSPILAKASSCCTETYLIVDTFESIKEAESFISYMNTSFFRFMMILVKNTQNISKGVFRFVPVQDYAIEWTDELLFKKYAFNNDEIKFVESMITSMKD